MFYYNYLGEIAGIRVFHIYALLLIVSSFRTGLRYVPRRLDWVTVLVVYILYLYGVFFWAQPKSAIFYTISLLAVLILKNGYLKVEKRVKEFFSVYVVTALLSYVTGFLGNNIYVADLILNRVSTSVSRMMGTFNDPNYMGMYYSVAVFSLITLRIFSRKVRIIFVCVLYTMIATTLSMTAIAGNALFWLIYLIAAKKLNLKSACGLVVIVGVLFWLYQYGLTHPDMQLFGKLSARISDKMVSLFNGDLSSTTTGRVDHAEHNLTYFKSQRLFRVLWGGNMVNNIVIDQTITSHVAHNEYIDLLLNVGIIGTACMLFYLLRAALSSFIKYWKSEDDCLSACIFMTKVIYVFYATTLTLFLEARFLIFYFI